MGGGTPQAATSDRATPAHLQKRIPTPIIPTPSSVIPAPPHRHSCAGRNPPPIPQTPAASSPNSSLPPSRGEVRWGVERHEPPPATKRHPHSSRTHPHSHHPRPLPRYPRPLPPPPRPPSPPRALPSPPRPSRHPSPLPRHSCAPPPSFLRPSPVIPAPLPRHSCVGRNLRRQEPHTPAIHRLWIQMNHPPPACGHNVCVT